jgi:hypothetical protein
VTERAHQSARAGAPDGGRAPPVVPAARAGPAPPAEHELVGVARRHDLAGELETARGGGLPLPDPRRDELERRLGVGLRAVRLHRGPRADALADALGATAFTTGDDVFVHRTAPELATSAGRHLLAHEVFHVIQQRRGPVEGAPGPGGLFVSHPTDRHERAAASAAEQIAQGGRVDLGATAGASGPARSGSAVQRQTPMEIATDVAPVLPAAATVARPLLQITWWALLPSEIAALEAGAAVPVAGTTAALVSNPVGWIVLGTVVVVGVGVAVYLVVRALETPAENQPLSGERPKGSMALHRSPPPAPAPLATAGPTKGTMVPLEAPGATRGAPVQEPFVGPPALAPGTEGTAPVTEPTTPDPLLAPGAVESPEPLEAALPPNVAAALGVKLKASRALDRFGNKVIFRDQEVALILKRLGTVPEGAAIATHILGGRFDMFQGYGELLSSCKSTETGSVDQALRRAGQVLSADPGVILRFEDKEDVLPPPDYHDVDLGVVALSGGYVTIWQFKRASGSGNVARNATRGGPQLQDVPATRKIVEIEVLPNPAKADDGSSTFFDAGGFDRGLQDWRVRYPDIELQITFTDGKTRTY